MALFGYIGQALVGWLLADLLSGVVHWLEDRVLRMDTPILGAAIVVPNRVHHTDPLAFTRSSLISRNEWLWLLAAIVSAGLWFAGTPRVLWAFLTVGGMVVNEVHLLAHKPTVAGPAVRMLQDIGFFQSPRHHAGHHRSPNEVRYCILTNYVNPVLDRLDVWNRLERLLEWMHLEPNRGTA